MPKKNLFPKKRTTLKILNQTGSRKDLQRDKSRTAGLPGKRISITGNIYWETRKNRSDKLGQKI